MGWGAIAVVIGIITLFIISSAVSVIIVLKHNRRAEVQRSFWKERSIPLSVNLY